MTELDNASDKVTAKWLTQVLGEKGHLNTGIVTGVNVRKRFETPPSIISHLEVSYSKDAPATAPSRLVLKIPKSQEIVTSKQEAIFYTTVALKMPGVPLVGCYNAVYSPNPGESYLLLEDVSETHGTMPGLTPTHEQAELVMDALAKIHAMWWDSDEISSMVGSNSEEGFADEFEGNDRRFAELSDILGDQLSAEKRRIFEKYLLAAPCVLLRRARQGHGITLCHPDSHSGNFLVPRYLDHYWVYVIDWQKYRCYWGPTDVSFFITYSWTAPQRRFVEMPLLRRYHKRLLEYGVQNYSWDDCWLDYRLAAIENLSRPLGNRISPRVITQVDAAIHAFQELNCDELLGG